MENILNDFISHYFIIILPVLIVFILLIYPKKKNPNTIQGDKKQVNMVFYYNECIDGYNDLINRVLSLQEQAQVSALNFKDKESFDRVIYISNNFENLTHDTMRIFKVLETAVKDNKPKLFKANLNIARENLSELGRMCEELTNINNNISDHRFDNIESAFENNNGYGYDYSREYCSNENNLNKMSKYNTNNEKIYFNGCETLEQLEKRYRSLAKAFHPDTGSGDTESFKKMKEEYDKIKSKMEVNN